MGNISGNGIPMTHALGRLFGAKLYILWLLIRLAHNVLSLLPFSSKIGQLDPFSRRVREGSRFAARFHAIRDARYEELRSGGHHFHMTVPQDAAAAISRWLK